MIFGKHINRYYLRFAPAFLIGLAALIAVDWFQMIIPNLYQMVINGINEGYVIKDGVEYAFNMDFLLDHICMPLVGVILCLVVGRFTWRVCFMGSAIGMEADLRNRMFSHCKDLSREYYQVNKVGNLMSLYTNDLDTIQECYGWGIMECCDAAFLGGLAIFKMWNMNPMLTCFAMIPMALLLGSSIIVGNYMSVKWE